MVQNGFSSIVNWPIGQVWPCNNGHNGGHKHRCAALCHIELPLGVFDQDWGSTPCIGESL
jgi:hypothetical protein